MKLSGKSTSRRAVAIAVALFVGAALASPASADDDDRGRGRKGRDKHDKHWNKRHTEVYCPAPVVRHAPRRVYHQPAVYVARRPFYECRQLGVYLPRSWVDVRIANRAPRGYVFYDPYCHRTFSTLARFRSHKRAPGHVVALDIVAIEDLRWEGRSAYYARDYNACAYGECGHDGCGYDGYANDRDWDERDRTRWSVSANINLD